LLVLVLVVVLVLEWRLFTGFALERDRRPIEAPALKAAPTAGSPSSAAMRPNERSAKKCGQLPGITTFEGEDDDENEDEVHRGTPLAIIRSQNRRHAADLQGALDGLVDCVYALGQGKELATFQSDRRDTITQENAMSADRCDS
jgi:hypothetical protein